MNLITKLFAAIAVLSAAAAYGKSEDPYLWLEDVLGDRAMAWVKERDAETQSELEGRPEFKALHQRLIAIYNSRDRIPTVQKLGPWLYNLWQDADNPRGIWRRTTLEEFRKDTPKWEVVLDIDKLGAAEKEKWVWKRATCLHPDYDRCLVSLSRGGADAVEIREFDAIKKEFVKGGFFVPESKGSAAWRHIDALYVEDALRPGSLTQSGYPRLIKEWRRNTPLAVAKVVREGKESDVSVRVGVVNDRERRYELISRWLTFWESEHFLRIGERWVGLDLPLDSRFEIGTGRLLIRLRSDWKLPQATYKAGALVAIDLDRFLAGDRRLDVLFEPTERTALKSFIVADDIVVLDILDNVKSRVVELRQADGRWVRTEVQVPPAATVAISPYERHKSRDYWMTATSFLQPSTLYLLKPTQAARENLKALPAFFDAKGLKTSQFEATSRDGTRIPYFVVMREDAKLDGANPTILYSYGGYEVSMLPNYSGVVGAAWLEKGGAWAVANIRGGGEFGPHWHRVAMRDGRQKTHDDFIAVAEDLVKRGISSPRHLGIIGGSQGGLLVGVAFTQRPDLFRAVACRVPLLDMKRYNKLLAGASWVGEYGDPDEPADWAFLSKYSPYQNVVKDKQYPRVFFYTSTRDDRVHPGHARKMVAKMKEQGHDVLYYEHIEGGHAAGSTPAQQAYSWALTYTFFLSELR